MPGVLIVDKHPLVRHGLEAVLSGAGFFVVGEAASAAEASWQLSLLQPPLMTLALGTAGPALELLQSAANLSPQTRTLVVSGETSRAHVTRALDLGALGYVSKAADISHVTIGLASIARGHRYLAVSATEPDVDAPGVPVSAPRTDPMPAVRLSRREGEVLKLVSSGLTSHQIATRLGISRRTVEAYRQCLMEKLCARNRADLVMRAVRRGLVRVAS